MTAVLQPLAPERAPYAGAPAGPDAEVVRLRDVTDALRRRWYIVAGCLAAGAAAAVAYARLTPPAYEAAATLRLEEKQATLPTVYTRVHDADAVATEVEVLRARQFAARAVDSLGLRVSVAAPRGLTWSSLVDSVRVTTAADTGTYRLVWGAPGAVTVARDGSPLLIATLRPGVPGTVGGVRLTLSPTHVPTGPVTLRVRTRDAAIDALQEAVHVSRVGLQTNAISLRYQNGDPALAQSVLAVWLGEYLASRQHAQRAEARSTATVLRAQLDTLNVELATSENAFRRFRERERVVNPETEATTQVTRLAQLQAERAGIDAEQRALAELFTSVRSAAAQARPEDPSPYRRVLGFPTLIRNQAATQLLNSLNDVENQRALLLTRRTAIDPDVRILTNRVHELEAQVRTVVESYLAGLTSQVAADDHELSSFGAQLGQVPKREIEFARLQRQPDVLSALVTTLSTRLKEAQVAAAVDDPTVQVVDPPYASTIPVRPKPLLALAFGVFGGLLAGSVGAFARQRADRSVRTLADVAWASGYPVVGSVPTLRLMAPPPTRSAKRRLAAGAGASLSPALAAVHATPDTVQALLASPAAEEAYARLYLNLVEGRFWDDTGPRSLLVTSPLPGDGKTTSAVNLALTLARRGIKTILVDADLRRGGIDTSFAVPRSPGLTEVLRGAVPIDDALRTLDVGTGHELTYLTTGALQHDAPSLLATPAMHGVHAALRREFQAVIFDTPPLAAVSDAAVLAPLVDGVVLVTRAGATARDAVTFAAGELRRVRAPLIGAVLNDVDPNADDRYAYGARYYAYASAAANDVAAGT